MDISLQKGLKAGVVSTFWVFKNENFRSITIDDSEILPRSQIMHCYYTWEFSSFSSIAWKFICHVEKNSFDCFEIKILWSFLHSFSQWKEKGNYPYYVFHLCDCENYFIIKCLIIQFFFLIEHTRFLMRYNMFRFKSFQRYKSNV